MSLTDWSPRVETAYGLYEFRADSVSASRSSGAVTDALLSRVAEDVRGVTMCTPEHHNQEDSKETVADDIAGLSAVVGDRWREVLDSLTRHLQAFANDVQLAPEERAAGRAYLTQFDLADERWQESRLLADLLGLSLLPSESDSSIGPIVTTRTPRSALADTPLGKPFGREGGAGGGASASHRGLSS